MWRRVRLTYCTRPHEYRSVRKTAVEATTTTTPVVLAGNFLPLEISLDLRGEQGEDRNHSDAHWNQGAQEQLQEASCPRL